jgi:drug/metabolite transporter (DMT)-like permease
MPVGVLFTFGAYALYSCCDAITKALGAGLSVFEIAFFTTLFSLVPALLTTPRGESWLRFWKVRNPLLVHLRGLSGVIGNITATYAFVSIPLAEAYSLAFLAPVFIVIIAALVLKETVSPQRWLVLGASFGGTLLVVRPGFQALELGHLLALTAAVTSAVTTTILRRIAGEEQRVSLIAIASAYILVFNGAVLLATGSFNALTLEQLGLLVAIGALGGTANLLFIAATRRSPASQIGPVQYSQVLWALLFGALFFAEYPVPLTYVGLAIIVIAGIMNVVSGEARLRIFSRNAPAGAGPSTLREAERAAANTPDTPSER